jgi:hypothetical protein
MMKMFRSCRIGGASAVIWLLPGDTHWVAGPTSMQDWGAATVIGAVAIAVAVAPAMRNGTKYFGVMRMMIISSII